MAVAFLEQAFGGGAGAETLRGNLREPGVPGQAEPGARGADQRVAHGVVEHWRQLGGMGQPLADAADHGIHHRAAFIGVIAAEKLGLVARDVHVGRAVGLAPLATQAQVQRILDLLVLPTVLDDLPLEQLEEQPGATTGRVLFFAGGAKAWAHGASVQRTALAHADAALRLACQPLAAQAGIVGEGALHRWTTVARPHAQVGIDRHRVDQLAWVHAVKRVPDGLELGKGLHDRLGIHDGQVLPLGLAVAMLARQRAAIAHHQVRSLLEKGAPIAYTAVGLQVEGDP